MLYIILFPPIMDGVMSVVPTEVIVSESQNKHVTTPCVSDVRTFLEGKVVMWKYFVAADGRLGALEIGQVPHRHFEPFRRFYWWSGTMNQTLGSHAHRDDTWQIYLGMVGRIEVVLEDGNSDPVTLVVGPGDAVFIPPMVWHDVTSREPGSGMAVLSNNNYDRSQYLEDREEFRRLAREY